MHTCTHKKRNGIFVMARNCLLYSSNMNENLGNKKGLNIVDEKWKFFFENKTLCNHYRSTHIQTKMFSND